MEHALVAGGSGFIGSHLCASLLERGLAVTCLDNLSTGNRDNVATLREHPHFSFLLGDVVTFDVPAYLDGADLKPAYVFHLASPASVVDYLRLPLETMMANSTGTLRLLDLAEAAGSRFLFASTSEIYGDPLVHPQVEEYWGNVNPNGPRSCYDESKRFGEAVTMLYFRSRGLNARVVRIFNTYGPHSRSDDGRVVPNFVGQALAGEPITIYGDGSQTRSFCYVSDLVSGIIKAMFSDGAAGQVFNLGNPVEHSVEEFAKIVAALVAEKNTGSRLAAPPIEWRDLPVDDPTRRRPDIYKAQSLLNWQPTVTLEDGLRRTIDWFELQRQRSWHRDTVAAAARGDVE